MDGRHTDVFVASTHWPRAASCQPTANQVCCAAMAELKVRLRPPWGWSSKPLSQSSDPAGALGLRGRERSLRARTCRGAAVAASHSILKCISVFPLCRRSQKNSSRRPPMSTFTVRSCRCVVLLLHMRPEIDEQCPCTAYPQSRKTDRMVKGDPSQPMKHDFWLDTSA